MLDLSSCKTLLQVDITLLSKTHNYMLAITWDFGTCTRMCQIKVKKKAKIRNRYKHHTQECQFKRPALTKQMTTRLQETDNAAWQRQTRNTKKQKGTTKEAQPWNGQ